MSDGPTLCTWKLGAAGQETVHTKEEVKPRAKILDSVLDAIGQTPMIRLNRVGKTDGVKCEILAKCEFFNAGGSVKDRIGRRMVLDAERSGRITPGDTLIEPTSGNTGIGLALAAAIKGYRMVITLPEKMSQEKVNVLKALGAEIIRTPTEAAWNAPESHIGVANRLNKEIPRSHILDQYKNPSNPLAHYDTTAEEIYEQCEGRIDAIVLTAGTGGTITGIARKLKEKIPTIKVIGVDPNGSILAQPEVLNKEGIHSYFVEGIGYDFIPTVLDRDVVDEWVKTNDKESFTTARRLIREEGLLCGGSSGSATWAAIQYAKTLPETARVVVLLPDSIRNYIVSKFANDEWMRDNGFLQEESTADTEQWWWNQAVGVLNLQTPYTVLPQCHCKDAIAIMKDHGFDQLPVVDEEGRIVGTITEGNITTHVVHRRVASEDAVSKVMYKQFRQVSAATTLGELSRIFDKEPFALVVASQKQVTRADGKEIISEKKIVTGVATRMDLLNYILKTEKK